MITVFITNETENSVDEPTLQKTIQDTLTEHGVTNNVSVDVAIVGDQKMDELAKKYYEEDPNDEYDHPILTFPTNELSEDFVIPTGATPSLGEMVISYPSAKWRAEEENMTTDEMICELGAHGSLHLAGVHHEH